MAVEVSTACELMMVYTIIHGFQLAVCTIYGSHLQVCAEPKPREGDKTLLSAVCLDGIESLGIVRIVYLRLKLKKQRLRPFYKWL